MLLAFTNCLSCSYTPVIFLSSRWMFQVSSDSTSYVYLRKGVQRSSHQVCSFFYGYLIYTNIVQNTVWKHKKYKRRSFGMHKSCLLLATLWISPLYSPSHRSEDPEELLFNSGIKTHQTEGTCETGFLLRLFLCAVVILKHIPKCSFRNHVIFFSNWWKENYVDPEGWYCLTSSLITWVTGCSAPSLC